MPSTSKRFHSDRFIIHPDHVGLVVKRIDLTGASIHEQKDNRFRFRSRSRKERGR